MKIAVVGAGWYGCHIALSLQNRGYEVDVFERGDRVFYGASGKNQNRLHFGFHYPRDSETRKQINGGVDFFLKTYPNLFKEVDNNYYAISKDESLIDFTTYKLILEAEGLNYKEEKCDFLDYENVSGSIRTNEMLIDTQAAKKFFSSEISNINFSSSISPRQLHTKKIGKTKYDWVINTTWNGLTSELFDETELYYEPCVMYCYRNLTEKQFAITIMDGNLFSLYPYFSDIYTLSSVEHIALDQCPTYRESLDKLMTVDVEYINHKRFLAEKKVKKYIPKFDSMFQYVNADYSVKTKMRSSTAKRVCVVRNEEGLIDIFSGKINTINYAEQKVLEIIQ